MAKQHSPLPTKAKPSESNKEPEGMDFFEALRHVIAGKRIHKLEWGDPEYYGYLIDGVLCLHKPTGRDHQWILSDGDLLGTDYIVLL